MRRFPTLPFRLAVLLVAAGPALAADTAETPAQTEARLKWWREARFGMFIHWSPSSLIGAEIGWDRKASRPKEAGGNRRGGDTVTVDPVYDNLHKRFDPVNYDAKAWVRLARDAGMKYMVFTTKHHEGFSMWPTKAREDFNIAKTPYKNGAGDILRDLADACHADDMSLGWYYSPRDWTNPDYGVGDNAKYEAFMTRQIDELLGDYGKIDMLWWDSFGQGDSLAYWHADKFIRQIKSINPAILTNDRCNSYSDPNGHRGVLAGDFDTPEQRLGKYQPDRPWETCMTLVGHGNWSYRPNGPMLSADQVITTLASCVTGDGNLLLNVGPMPDGRIEPRQAEVLRKVGEWMKVYGESVYATRGGPCPNGAWGGATFRDDTVWLHLFPAANGSVVLPDLGAKFVSAKNLGGGGVSVKTAGKGLEVSVPADARTGPDTVIRLTFDGPVKRTGEKAVPGRNP